MYYSYSFISGFSKGQIQAIKDTGLFMKNRMFLKVLSKIKRVTSRRKSWGRVVTKDIISSMSFLYWCLIDFLTFSYSYSGK